MALTRPRASQIITTSVDFTDSIVRINSGQTGANTNDIGIVFERGSLANVGLVWDESADAFRLISTTNAGAATADINISAHHNLHIGTLVSSGLTYPTSDGSAGQVLVTNGSGTLSFTDISTNLSIAGDSGTDTVSLLNDTLTFSGTSNEIGVAVTNNTVTFSLPDDVTIGDTLTVTGNLIVNGTTTTISTTNTTVSDNLIELNSGATSNANDSGILIERGTTGDNAIIAWDESADKFIVGTTTATASSTGNLTISGGTLVASTFEGNLTGNVTGNASTATALATARTIGGVTFDGTANINLPGVNTAGNQNTSGNAATATALATARTISLGGDLSGSASFDGSANITITAAVANDSHTHNYLIAVDDRDMKPNTSGISGSKAMRAFFSSFGGMTGTADTNYHDVLVLDTYSDSTGGGPNAITFDKGNSAGNPEAYLWKGAFDGTTWGTGQRIFADNYHPNADKWTTARTLSLTGAVTGSASIDGSGNVSLATTATSDPTLTLAGDASGSATFTNLGNATLTVTIADDSHNHTIANVDGLQTALDGKLDLTGGTVSGTVTASGLTVDTNTLYVDATNNRVGIGELTPDAQLHITASSGDTVLILEADPTNTNEADTPYIIFRADGSTGTTALVGLVGNSGDHATGTTSNSLLLEATGSRDIQIAPASSVSAHFDATGDVGIGTTSPSAKLEVVAASSLDTALGVTGDVSFSSGDFYTFGTGSVGFGDKEWATVGLTSPAKWEFYRNTATATLMIHQDDGLSNAELHLRSGTRDWVIANDTTDLSVTCEGTEVLNVSAAGTITANGLTVDTSTLVVDSTNNRVGIGTTTPSAALDVVGNAEINGNITVTGTVDGRDVAADGSKLDGIEASADVTDAGNVNPLVDSHLNTSTAGSGEVLSWTGTDYDWIAVGGSGTVTSVAATVPTGLSVSGSPITASGTLAISYAAGYQGYTSTEASKLAGIETGATADQTASEILTAIKTVDGSGSGLDADTLDGVQGSSFLRSDTADTFTGTLTAQAPIVVDQNGNSGNIVYESSGGCYVPRPLGGSYKTTGSTATGSVAIKLPTQSWNQSDMISFHVDIYDYAGSTEGETVTLHVYGYQYSTGLWTNTGATILSDRTDRDYTVRFGHDGTRHIIYIGETTSTWSYPQVNVRDFQAGYSASYANYDDAFAVTFETTHLNVTRTSSSNYPVSKYANNVRVDADNSTNATHYLLFTGGASGSQRANSDSGLTYNPSSNTLTTTNFAGQATTAKYADLAENYLADQAYPVGTILQIGGTAEVSIALENSFSLAGTVSENPGYLMNSELVGEHVTPVAYIGRVPCRVKGTVRRGECLVVSDTPGVAMVRHPREILPGQLVGKALQEYTGTGEGLIEILVGRL